SNLAGTALTQQRIPGQTTSGEYSPTGNSLGATYNYIPTGATQIDPNLIASILGINQQNAGAAGSQFSAGQQLLQQVLGLTGQGNALASGDPSQVSGNTGSQLNALQQYIQNNPNIASML